MSKDEAIRRVLFLAWKSLELLGLKIKALVAVAEDTEYIMVEDENAS